MQSVAEARARQGHLFANCLAVAASIRQRSELRSKVVAVTDSMTVAVCAVLSEWGLSSFNALCGSFSLTSRRTRHVLY